MNIEVFVLAQHLNNLDKENFTKSIISKLVEFYGNGQYVLHYVGELNLAVMQLTENEDKKRRIVILPEKNVKQGCCKCNYNKINISSDAGRDTAINAGSKLKGNSQKQKKFLTDISQAITKGERKFFSGLLLNVTVEIKFHKQRLLTQVIKSANQATKLLSYSFTEKGLQLERWGYEISSKQDNAQNAKSISEIVNKAYNNASQNEEVLKLEESGHEISSKQDNVQNAGPLISELQNTSSNDNAAQNIDRLMALREFFHKHRTKLFTVSAFLSLFNIVLNVISVNLYVFFALLAVALVLFCMGALGKANITNIREEKQKFPIKEEESDKNSTNINAVDNNQTVQEIVQNLIKTKVTQSEQNQENSKLN